MTNNQVTTYQDASIEKSLSQSLVNDWLVYNADKSPSTVKTYTMALKHFIGYLAENNITNPTRDTVIAYRNNLCTSKKISTAKLYLTAVKIFARWLASRNLFPNFADNVRPLNLDEDAQTHSREALTLEEVKDVLEFYRGKKDVKSLRDALILRLMINCGLRSVEVVRLDATDVELRHKKIYLRVWGKGRKSKTARVEISRKIFDMINEYLATRKSQRKPGEPMFVSTANRNHGQRLQTQTVSRLAKKTFREVGIDSPSLTCHSCRHTCAQILIHSGIVDGGNIDKVRRLLRHKNSATTRIYLADVEADYDNTVQSLSDLIDSVLCA